MTDLTSLFQPADDPANVKVRQGVVVAWDNDTAENTIAVAGGELLNVPSLIAETVSLAAGDVVALLSMENKWLLLGKVTTPGDPDQVPTWNADLSALAPLVDLAAVTTGTTVTGATLETPEVNDGIVTGALLRTAASGRRIEIAAVNLGTVTFYSGSGSEIHPGQLDVASDQMLLQPPDLGLDRPGLVFKSTSNAGVPYAGLFGSEVAISGDTFEFNGNPVMVAGGNPQPVKVADATTLTLTSPALTSTYAPGSPVCGTTFVAPASGSVYITVSGRIQNDTATNTTYLSYEVRDGAVVGSGTPVLAPDSGGRALAAGIAASARAGGSRRYLLTGLTPGNSYNVRTMHAGQMATGGATIFNRDLLVEPVL